MNPLLNQNPLNTSLSGAQHLSSPTGSVPGSGFFNSIANLFRAPAPGTSLTGNNPSPLLNPGLTNTTLPGLGSVVAGMPGLPSIHGGNAPASQPVVGLGLGPQTAQASTNPVNVGASDPARNPVFLAPSAPAPASSPTSQAGYNVGNYTPQNFTVPTNKVYDSSYLSPGALQDLQDARNAKQDAMTSGSADGTNLIPSDTLQGQIANQLYQSKLYSPDEQSLIANGQDLTAQINQKKLAERRKTAQLLEDGTITKEQATQFVQESERRANQELADLSVQQDSNTAKLTTLGLLRQNQVGALTSVADMLKGSEVSPGSSVYNPITGVQYQGTGAAPAQIASYAQQLEQSSIQQGTAQYMPDGSINHGYYYQVASQQLSPNAGSALGGGAQGGSQGFSGATSVSDPAFYNSLPNTVAPAFRTLANGQAYFDSSNLDASGLGTARAISKQFGIPILSSEKVSAVEDLQSVENGLSTTEAYFKQLAPNGLLGKLGETISNPLSKLFSTDYGSLLKTYQSNKDNLFRQVSAFAGSHPRINSTELVTQAQALPTIGNTPFSIDSLKDGLNKMQLLRQSLDNIRSSIIPNATGQYQTPATTVGGTVQTKAGTINTNW